MGRVISRKDIVGQVRVGNLLRDDRANQVLGESVLGKARSELTCDFVDQARSRRDVHLLEDVATACELLRRQVK